MVAVLTANPSETFAANYDDAVGPLLPVSGVGWQLATPIKPILISVSPSSKSRASARTNLYDSSAYTLPQFPRI